MKRNVVLGICGAIFMFVPMPGIAAQGTDVHAEVRAIRDADQADRQKDWSKISKDELEAIAERDTRRLERIKILLQEGKLETAEDFDNAALVFQHGTTVNDYLTAHELSFIQLLKAERGGGNLVVLSEDRFLDRIAQRQRFGTQGAFAADGSKRIESKPVVEDGLFAVTDTLRADLFLPPLALYKQHGPQMPPGSFDPIIERIKVRSDKKWQAEAADKTESKELARIVKAGAPRVYERDQVLKWYRADLLRTPDDYKNAATILLITADTTNLTSEQEASAYLLAHELATVAAARSKSMAAAKLVAMTMDRFLLRVGLSPRYSESDGTAEPIEPATASVRKALGL